VVYKCLNIILVSKCVIIDRYRLTVYLPSDSEGEKEFWQLSTSLRAGEALLQNGLYALSFTSDDLPSLRGTKERFPSLEILSLSRVCW
jgi:hypothetical protein